jgi:hypothetical protein
VKASGILAVPEDVVTVTSITPPAVDAGLRNERLVPSSLSVQDGTWFEPTATEVTPTRKDPVSVTAAPPVFGISVLFFCKIEAD